MLRDIKAPQRKMRIIPFQIDGTGTASITQGSSQGTLVDNGTGDYTITLTTPGTTLWGAFGTAVDDDAYMQIDASDSSASAVNVVWKDDANNAEDCIFYLYVLVSDTADEY